jgi:hypothetical protein
MQNAAKINASCVCATMISSVRMAKSKLESEKHAQNAETATGNSMKDGIMRVFSEKCQESTVIMRRQQ